VLEDDVDSADEAGTSSIVEVEVDAKVDADTDVVTDTIVSN